MNVDRLVQSLIDAAVAAGVDDGWTGEMRGALFAGEPESAVIDAVSALTERGEPIPESLRADLDAYVSTFSDEDRELLKLPSVSR